jgi:hypothetical protein
MILAPSIPKWLSGGLNGHRVRFGEQAGSTSADPEPTMIMDSGWRGLIWTLWAALERQAIHQTAVPPPGVYRIRRCGNDQIGLTYSTNWQMAQWTCCCGGTASKPGIPPNLMAVVGGLLPDSYPVTNLRNRTLIRSPRPSTTCVARFVAVDVLTR